MWLWMPILQQSQTAATPSTLRRATRQGHTQVLVPVSCQPSLHTTPKPRFLVILVREGLLNTGSNNDS